MHISFIASGDQPKEGEELNREDEGSREERRLDMSAGPEASWRPPHETMAS
jgi:hypothetical protein